MTVNNSKLMCSSVNFSTINGSYYEIERNLIIGITFTYQVLSFTAANGFRQRLKIVLKGCIFLERNK